MNRDRITENLVEFTKSSGLHPMKNSEKPKGIIRFTCLVLHYRKREAVKELFTAFYEDYFKSQSQERGNL